MSFLARILIPTVGAATLYRFASPTVMVGGCVFVVLATLVMIPRIKRRSLFALLLYPVGLALMTFASAQGWGAIALLGLTTIAASGISPLQYKESGEKAAQVAEESSASAPWKPTHNPSDPFSDEEILSANDLAKRRAQKAQEAVRTPGGSGESSGRTKIYPERVKKPLPRRTRADLDIYG